MVAKLSGATQRAIIAALDAHEQLTTAELSRLIGRSHDATHSSLLLLRERRIAYIAGYITTPGKGRESRVWALGDKPDAKRPDYGGEYLKASRRDIARRHYLKKALKRDGPSPWAGLIPIVQRKVAL